MEPNEYSKIVTKRFKELGVTPCLRRAHKAIEMTSSAEYESEDGDETQKDVRFRGYVWAPGVVEGRRTCLIRFR
jgi:hypothetical protein